jgi:glutamate dehydrogenase
MAERLGHARLEQVAVTAEVDGATITVEVSEEAATLSLMVPLLERLGFDVVSEQTVEAIAGRWRHVMRVRHPSPSVLTSSVTRRRVSEAIRFDWLSPGGSDDLQQLIVTADLDQIQVEVLRAYTRYLNQVGSVFSQATLVRTLAHHPKVVTILCRLFAARFDPSLSDGVDSIRSEHMVVVGTELTEALEKVGSLDDDRVLRGYSALMNATVRTNTYRTDRFGTGTDSRPRPGAGAIAFKFDPARVPDLPLPRPKHEIWVAGPTVEGVHLRGGDVARGGIRWSDRSDDFRTEVLGLMKAQMVKNSIIVPVGAKGGFVPKDSVPGEPLAGQDAYRTFVGALLDVTDNLMNGATVRPNGVVCHDADDTYFVVAADKGTARFSDIANDVAAQYGYWLGDAFASGGSHGYDHKAIGITARGAWESVRRHFRSIGMVAETAHLVVVGIGDMSGDVFGNGMLQSSRIQLVAAFDHRHIFLDPNPDPELSFAERGRLFAMQRSSWADYDRTTISPGGGVFARTSKSIPLTDEVKQRLGVTAERLTPDELAKALLRAPVDLLWNGGIGTYVKASVEDHDDVGDRANDALRVNGNELRCKVVAEGGNLGLTQLGRIEYAMAGGLLNTDAVDNSAGVDTSDHEVNIKIALDAAQDDDLLEPTERNQILAAMEDDVVADVLQDNRDQNTALAIARARSVPMMDAHARYLRALEAEFLIDRQIEYLPNEKQFAERRAAGIGLTTPEFAVLLAYTKNSNTAELLTTDLADDPYLQRTLFEYFPSAMRTRFSEQLLRHPLRRQILVTALTNEMVNRSGITFDHRMLEETGAALVDTTRAWVVARDVLDMRRWWHEIELLPVGVEPAVQLDLFLALRQAVERAATWLVGHRPPSALVDTVELFGEGVRGIATRLDEWAGGSVSRDLRLQAAGYREVGVPGPLARVAANWSRLNTAFDIVEIARAHGRSAPDVTRTYWATFERVEIGWIWDQIGLLNRSERWANQARSAVRDDLLSAIRRLVDTVLSQGDSYDAPDVVVNEWARVNPIAIERTRRMFTEIRAGGVFDVTTLTVAVRQLHNLATACMVTG